MHEQKWKEMSQHFADDTRRIWFPWRSAKTKLKMLGGLNVTPSSQNLDLSRKGYCMKDSFVEAALKHLAHSVSCSAVPKVQLHVLQTQILSHQSTSTESLLGVKRKTTWWKPQISLCWWQSLNAVSMWNLVNPWQVCLWLWRPKCFQSESDSAVRLDSFHAFSRGFREGGDNGKILSPQDVSANACTMMPLDSIAVFKSLSLWHSHTHKLLWNM